MLKQVAIHALHLLRDSAEDIVLQCTLLLRGVLKGLEDAVLEFQKRPAVLLHLASACLPGVGGSCKLQLLTSRHTLTHKKRKQNKALPPAFRIPTSF